MSNLVGVLNGRSIKMRAAIPAQNDYDDTELREMIAETLVDAQDYTDEAIANFQEQDPNMVFITNQEINEIFNRYI